MRILRKAVASIALAAMPLGFSHADSFQGTVRHVSQEIAEGTEQTKKTLGATEIKAVSLSQVKDPAILVLSGVCTKKRGWGPFKRDEPTACYALKFIGAYEQDGRAVPIDKPLWAMPIETREEAQHIQSQLMGIGRTTKEAALTFLQKPIAQGDLTGQERLSDGEEVYLVVSLGIRTEIPLEGATLREQVTYTFVQFK